jgi:hypothetical protein
VTCGSTFFQLQADPATTSLVFSPSVVAAHHAELSIFDPTGRLILSQGVRGGEAVSVASHSQGLYVAKLANADGILATQKFVKE